MRDSERARELIRESRMARSDSTAMGKLLEAIAVSVVALLEWKEAE